MIADLDDMWDSHAMINSSIFTHRCNASVHSYFSFRYICVVHTPSISPAACGGSLLCGSEPLKGVPALFKPRVRGSIRDPCAAACGRARERKWGRQKAVERRRRARIPAPVGALVRPIQGTSDRHPPFLAQLLGDVSPALVPQRVSLNLAQNLQRRQPTWLLVHSAHSAQRIGEAPAELKQPIQRRAVQRRLFVICSARVRAHVTLALHFVIDLAFGNQRGRHGVVRAAYGDPR